MGRLRRYLRILYLTRSLRFAAAAASQRASGQLAEFLAAGGKVSHGVLAWRQTPLGGPGFDLRALPDAVAMLDLGVRIEPASIGWHVRVPQGPIFRFEDADLYGGLGVLKERFIENEFSGFSVEGAVVIDIGAHFGDSAVWFAINGATRVLAYEPFPHNARVAAESLRLNRVEDRVELEVAGVGVEAEHLEVPYDRTLSVVQTARPGANRSTDGELTKVELIPFAAVVARAATKPPSADLAVKIDCEGCEEDIFSASHSWAALGSVSRLIVEWHRAETLDPFLTQLRATGFAVESRPTDDGTFIVLAERSLR